MWSKEQMFQCFGASTDAQGVVTHRSHEELEEAYWWVGGCPRRFNEYFINPDSIKTAIHNACNVNVSFVNCNSSTKSLLAMMTTDESYDFISNAARLLVCSKSNETNIMSLFPNVSLPHGRIGCLLEPIVWALLLSTGLSLYSLNQSCLIEWRKEPLKEKIEFTGNDIDDVNINPLQYEVLYVPSSSYFPAIDALIACNHRFYFVQCTIAAKQPMTTDQCQSLLDFANNNGYPPAQVTMVYVCPYGQGITETQKLSGKKNKKIHSLWSSIEQTVLSVAFRYVWVEFMNQVFAVPCNYINMENDVKKYFPSFDGKINKDDGISPDYPLKISPMKTSKPQTHKKTKKQ